MTVKHADGVSHRYVRYSTSLRRAKREARRWVERGRVEGETLVGVRPANQSSLRKSLALAGLVFVACCATMAAFIFGLSLGGVL
jgi:hypothetical protein